MGLVDCYLLCYFAFAIVVCQCARDVISTGMGSARINICLCMALGFSAQAWAKWSEKALLPYPCGGESQRSRSCLCQTPHVPRHVRMACSTFRIRDLPAQMGRHLGRPKSLAYHRRSNLAARPQGPAFNYPYPAGSGSAARPRRVVSATNDSVSGPGFACTNGPAAGPGFACTNKPAFGQPKSLAYCPLSNPIAQPQGPTPAAYTNKLASGLGFACTNSPTFGWPKSLAYRR